jgi:hypothetical protein
MFYKNKAVVLVTIWFANLTVTVMATLTVTLTATTLGITGFSANFGTGRNRCPQLTNRGTQCTVF